jgi:hypothetical protein
MDTSVSGDVPTGLAAPQEDPRNRETPEPLSELGSGGNAIMCGSVKPAISLHKNGGEEEAEVIAASSPLLEVEEVGPPPPADEEGEYYSCSYTSMMASGRRGRSFPTGEEFHRGELEKEGDGRDVEAA